MIDYETILSTTEDKLTLLQWLKKVEAALKDASATTFKVNKKGDATLTFSIVFADGTELESGEIVLQQGESVQSGAIVNGHLMLTLTNGEVLDCGELLNGNVNIIGTLNATKVTGDEIVETMTGYSYSSPQPLDETIGIRTITYAGQVKNGNKLTMAIAFEFTRTGNISDGILVLGTMNIPASIGAKLYPAKGSWLSFINLYFADSHNSGVTLHALAIKDNNKSIRFAVYGANALTLNTQYYARAEVTFLLSDNLAA